MTDLGCRFERDVARAARSGEWTGALREHVDACGHCRETQAIAGFMGRAAVSLGLGEPVPDPTLIWLKARLARREARDERIARLQRISLGTGGLVLGLAAWAAIYFVAPILATLSDAFPTMGASVAIIAPIVWWFGFRPLHNAR